MNDETIKCPHCNCDEFLKRGRSYKTLKTIWWTQKYQCKQCKTNFKGKARKATIPEAFIYKPKTLEPRNWKAINDSQTNEKRMFLNLLQELLNEITIKETVKPGRPSKNIKDILFCMLLKTYTRLSSRRLISDLEATQKQGFIESHPSFSTLMSYYNDKRLKPLLTALIELSSTPIASLDEQHFSCDSSGFSTSKFGRWMDYRFDKEIEKRIYRKSHIAIGAKTNIVTSVVLTDQFGADSPQLKHLVKRTSINFEIKEFSADRAYLSRDNLEFISELGGVPLIPFKSNTRREGGKNGLIWRKMYLYFRDNPQSFFRRYHQRSNVESCFNQIKSKFGDSLMTRNFEANFVEILCKILAHNLVTLIRCYFEFGLQADFHTEASVKEELVIKV